ncbi:PP2C family protein-serine/threonine phosphatase [Neoroseomonas oryzicola]|uniref:Serine/threonine-protein phosphatase n=1 Tax=Neoroseomonas oryzicola TaxID=535904 RepID=A0A9X9WN15_9PROT|nr:protein phosphatase 2C domain-containing protein [Neoroseomonas oryzicola]MBR0661725.1 serine/threonine-protein phosphatase [Neoroseomonas oryzicola]NKE17197.1 serine/threonine-protein phosphatase [Neoroseomonas oryzicola]
MSVRLISHAATHPGAVRPRNEDALLDRPEIGLWAVADGAGGHGAGDVASSAIIAALQTIPPGLSAAELLAQVRLKLITVHSDLQEEAERRGPGRIVASTVVVMLARGDHFAMLWAGDSRGYLLRGGVLQRVTRDHSLVQELVDQGSLREEEAESHPQANVITRAVGAHGELELDKVSGRIMEGDRYLLCTDGLFKTIPEAEIGAMLSNGSDPAAIVTEAVGRGARDNVSVVAVACEG